VVRLTKPGRLSCVHCTDLKRGPLYQRDFPGDIVDLHEKHGMHYFCGVTIWKDPWEFARRTRMKTLMHMTIVKDSATSRIAPADYLKVFVKSGANAVPITHERGFKTYPGSKLIPRELKEYLGFKGDQRENRLSHWIYRQLASPVWMDIRRGRMLPFDESKEDPEERHVCCLQLDIIERCLMLWSNPGDLVLDPFLGVGSTAFASVKLGRRALATELKPTYWRQAIENMKAVDTPNDEGYRFEITDEQEEEEDDVRTQSMMF
jgi:DNA modification methylase